MKQQLSYFRTGLVGLGILAGGGALAVASLAACGSLSDTSVIPDTDASDFDGGFIPDPPEDAAVGGPAPVDAGPAPQSARVRIANLLEDGPALDLCAKFSAPTTLTYDDGRITGNPQAPKPEGLKFGEISTYLFVPVPTPLPPLCTARDPGCECTTSATCMKPAPICSPQTKLCIQCATSADCVTGQSCSPAGQCTAVPYSFKIIAAGGSCDSAMTPTLLSITPGASTTLRQGGSTTIAITGVVKAGDPGDTFPRAIVLPDTVTPPATVSSFRVFHAVPDMAAFDVVINGETVLNGIRFSSAIGAPYTSTTGFASIAAGVPEGATLLLRAGTTVRSYVVPDRLRRGVATTVFVSGSLMGSSPLTANLCSDRLPADSQATTGTCKTLEEQK